LSMTGFGEAHCQQDGLTVAVEVRSFNSRFFKLSVRSSEGYGALESQIEEVVRRTIRRGTVQINLRIERAKSAEDFRINSQVLDGYRAQLESLQQAWNAADGVALEALLGLPGVVDENGSNPVDAAGVWPAVETTVRTAMENLGRMRAEEGKAMAADLKANCRTAAESLAKVQQRAPLVVESYRVRLEERLKKILQEYEVVIEPSDLIKEVGMFAERSDISEEIVRLQSHIDQFLAIMGLAESSGRKLEFLCQEMVREANTIGSKANDVEIAQQVIEIKAAIERIREMIQNVE